MEMPQRVKPLPGATFGVVAVKVFDIVTDDNSKHNDVVFDVYQDILSRMQRAQKEVQVRKE